AGSHTAPRMPSMVWTSPSDRRWWQVLPPPSWAFPPSTWPRWLPPAGPFSSALIGFARYTTDVVPAKAGTHIPGSVVMGPRLRGDDTLPINRHRAGFEDKSGRRHHGRGKNKARRPRPARKRPEG